MVDGDSKHHSHNHDCVDIIVMYDLYENTVNVTHEQLMTFKLTVKVVPMTTLCGTDSTLTFTSP